MVLMQAEWSELKHVTLFFPADKAVEAVTMETISGLTIGPEDTSLDRKENRNRRCGRCRF